MDESLIRKDDNMKKNRTPDLYALDISCELICNKLICNIFTSTKRHDWDLDCHVHQEEFPGLGRENSRIYNLRNGSVLEHDEP